MPSSTSARACSSGRVWPGLIGTPCVLLLELSASFAMIPWSCEQALPFALHFAIGGALAIALGVAGLSWRWLAPPARRGQHFLGLVSLAVSALVTLVIAVQWFTVFVVPRCIASP
jgi:hypothetical protein